MFLSEKLNRLLPVCAAATGLAACATAEPQEAGYGEAQWAANGWLTPNRTGEPELVGLYVTRAACEDALDDWMARQVVGNPVDGECLPIDRH